MSYDQEKARRERAEAMLAEIRDTYRSRGEQPGMVAMIDRFLAYNANPRTGGGPSK